MRDIDTLLRQCDPAADTPAYTPAERDNLLGAAVDAPSPRSRRGWRLGAVAAAAALVTALGVTNLQGNAVSARADEVLTQAAINAADPPSRPDQWWQITTAGTNVAQIEETMCIVHTERTEWVAVDGSRPTVIDEGTGRFTPVEPGTACPQPRPLGIRSMNLAPADLPAAWQLPTPQFLAEQPRDVDALRAKLYADSAGQGNGADAEVFVHVADVLRSGLVPADLRASLFEVLTTVPGIEVTSEEVIDGRTIVALAIDDAHGNTDQLLVDPEGGTVVGERDVYPELDVETGERVSRELVDEIPTDVLSRMTVSQCEVVDGEVACQG